MHYSQEYLTEYFDKLLAKNNKPLSKKMAIIEEFVIRDLYKFRRHAEEEKSEDSRHIYELPSRYLQDVLRLKNDLGEMIKAYLFEKVDGSYRTGKLVSKQNPAYSLHYYFNRDNYEKLLGKTHEQQVLKIVDEIKQHIKNGRLHIEYHEPVAGNRLHHYLQNVPAPVRSEAFARCGYMHDYDINSACVSILTQHALNLGASAESIKAALDYVHSKQELREHIAKTYEIKIEDVKKILTSICYGAKVTPYLQYATAIVTMFKKYANGRDKAEQFVKDPMIKAYDKACRNCWAVISKYERKYNKGKWNFRSIAGHNGKAAYYMHLERKLMDKVSDWLLNEGYDLFRIHDGFLTNGKIDIVNLIKHLSEEIGFNVSFSLDEWQPTTEQLNKE